MGETGEARPKRRGNYKPGPGRPRGRKNNATLALEAAAQEAAASIDGAFEGDAHAFLVAVYRNPAVPLELRIMAASRALRVEKPALAATEGRIAMTVNIAARMEAARRRLGEGAGRVIEGEAVGGGGEAVSSVRAVSAGVRHQGASVMSPPS